MAEREPRRAMPREVLQGKSQVVDGAYSSSAQVARMRHIEACNASAKKGHSSRRELCEAKGYCPACFR